MAAAHQKDQSIAGSAQREPSILDTKSFLPEARNLKQTSASIVGPVERGDYPSQNWDRGADRPDESGAGEAEARQTVRKTTEPVPLSELSHTRPEFQPGGSSGLPGTPGAEQKLPVEREIRAPRSNTASGASAPDRTTSSDIETPLVQSVQIQMDDESGSGINLRFVESGGGVRVSIRTLDASLADSLNANSHALEGRLQAAGWSSEFHPVAERLSGPLDRIAPDTRTGQEISPRSEAATSQVRGAQMEFGAGTGDSSGERSSTWADRNEDLLNAIALRRLANKGALR
ncbi:hypothetical protein [Paludibaculum fermentans]|uniref:hypothetical protein n=1 Tax=Paludibaculum fermentans TaxID=1473598 RepID=UPI003EB9F5A4